MNQLQRVHDALALKVIVRDHEGALAVLGDVRDARRPTARAPFPSTDSCSARAAALRDRR